MKKVDWANLEAYPLSLVFADSDGDTIVSFKLNNPPCDDSNDPNFTYYEKIARTPYIDPEQSYYSPRAYFVKSLTGDIWMVRRRKVDKHSFKLHVYKLELDVQNGKLEQINKLESLEDNILFVGICGDSISMPSYCFSKLEKDSIYFVCEGDKKYLGLDIYNVKDGSFRRESLPLSFKWMQLFWVLPQFQWD